MPTNFVWYYKTMKLTHLAIVAIIIFILTYDPKSGTLTKFITNDPTPNEKQNPNKKCCNDPNCAAKHPGPVSYTHLTLPTILRV